MKHCDANQVNRGRVSRWAELAALIVCLSLSTIGGLSQAAGFSSPKECQSFEGDAHLTCLYAYIEQLQKNTSTVQSEMTANHDMVEQMRTQRTQVDQPSSIADEGQRGPADRAEMPQVAAAPARPPDTITPGVGSPVECRAYSGAAHLNCLYAFIEIEHNKARNIEEELKTQKHMLGQLRDQMDRQASASQDLQRKLAERDAISSSAPAYIPPPIYPGYGYPGYVYPGYAYPAPGFSLYLGVPGYSGYYWGRPFYGPSFFGPRFYGHHRR